MDLIDLAKFGLDYALRIGVTQVQVSAYRHEDYLTRFANNIIHQNVGELGGGVWVKAVLGKCIGNVGVNSLTEEAVKKAVDGAIKIAKITGEDPDFRSLPGAEPIEPLEGLYFPETASFTPEDRADFVLQLIDAATGLDKRVKSVAGALSTGWSEEVIVNSLGVEAYQKGSMASININIIAEEDGEAAYGFAADESRDVGKLNPAAIGLEAAQRAVAGFGARRIEPGEYPVILEHYASATITSLLGWATSSREVQDGVSVLTGRLGQKVASSLITLIDDGRDLRSVGASAFDGEGVPKRRLVLVEEGVLRNYVYDSYTAGKEGRKSTGHGPYAYPSNLFLNIGDASKEELIESMDKGILITRFHYTNIVDQRRGIFTAMTRDGTWLIEKGEISYPIKNMRITDELLKVLTQVSMLGREAKGLGATFVPPIKIDSLRFIGTTEF